MSTAKRIKELRLRNGWTQSRLAALTGLHVTHISHFEHGREPSTKNLMRLARALGTDPNDLLGWKEEL